jgi:hypothetical protein
MINFVENEQKKAKNRFKKQPKKLKQNKSKKS